MSKVVKADVVSKETFIGLVELVAYLIGNNQNVIPIFKIKETDERGPREYAISIYDPREDEDFWIESFKTLKQANAWAEKYLHCKVTSVKTHAGKTVLSLDTFEDRK